MKSKTKFEFDKNGNIKARILQIERKLNIKPIKNIEPRTISRKYNWDELTKTTLNILETHQKNGYETIGFDVKQFFDFVKHLGVEIEKPATKSAMNSFKYQFDKKMQKFGWKVGFYTNHKKQNFVFYPMR